MTGSDEHRLLTPVETAHRLGMPEAELTRLRCAGDGPDWILIGRTVRYSLADLRWWQTHPTASCR